jgi:ribosomal protein L16 Arg81 hydroxylase
MSKLKANYHYFNDEILLDLFIKDSPFLIRNFVENPECLATWEDVEKCFHNPFLAGYLMHPTKGKILDDGSEWEFHRNAKNRFDILHEGGGVCILDYGEYNEETNELMGFFEDKFNVNARTFIQTHLHGMSGYGLHADARETMGIFILQVEGLTEWKIYDNRFTSLVDQEHPLYLEVFNRYNSGELKEKIDEKMNLVLEKVLTPGDLIYIPHRMYHHAVPSQRRISLSIPCFIREPDKKPDVDRRFYRIDKSRLHG